jgi:hypothetical protein
MAIFAIFRVSNPPMMESALQRVFPKDHLKVATDEWLVSAIGTAKEVSDKIGITPGPDLGSAMVFSMANYYGRATTEIWDWIKAKSEAPGG